MKNEGGKEQTEIMREAFNVIGIFFGMGKASYYEKLVRLVEEGKHFYHPDRAHETHALYLTVRASKDNCNEAA